MKKHLTCGIDEAGRGALAGPIVIAAVVMLSDFNFQKVAPKVLVRDSKQLSTRQRERVLQLIEIYSLHIEIEVLSVEEINRRGINWANIEGFRRHIANIEADEYIIDGRWNLPDLGAKTPLTRCIIRADQKIPSVLASGIVAKVKRDEIMKKIHLDYPIYGWNTNTGHGTKKHIEAIAKHGICHHHRTLFVSSALKNASLK